MSPFVKPTERVIGENTYYIRKFEPFVALKIVGELQKRLLAPAAGLIAAMKGGAESPETDNEALIAGIKQLSEALNGPDLEFIARMLINPEYVTVVTPDDRDGTKLTIDTANRVMSDVFDIVELCKAIAEVNFSDFGKRVRALFG